MERNVTTLFTLSALCLAAVGHARDALPPPEPLRVLNRASDAFRALGSFRGAMHLTVTPPGQEPTKRKIDFGAGPAGIFVDAGFQRIVAAEGRIVATQVDIMDKYVSAPFGGDFGAAIAAIGGEQLQIPDLPPIVFHQEQEEKEWIDSFRLRILGPVSVKSKTSVSTVGGRPSHVVEMTAENGTVKASFDLESGLLISMDLEATPQGAPPSMVIAASALFTIEGTDELAGLLTFDSGDRTAVSDLEALNAELVDIGFVLPSLVLESVHGTQVDLGRLRGNVVVLDFWASWCAPCWMALEQLEDFARWAEDSGLPLVVWAVNTYESPEDPTTQVAIASRFWEERGFQMDSLVDTHSELFDSIGAPGLPSTVVIAPDGSLAVIHQGVLQDAQAKLRADVEKLLESSR